MTALAMPEDASRWLILSWKRGAWGNSCVWWGPDFGGYTSHLDSAGRYTKAQAKDIEICSPIGHLGTKDAVAVPLAEAEKASHRSVDFGRARELWPGPGVIQSEGSAGARKTPADPTPTTCEEVPDAEEEG